MSPRHRSQNRCPTSQLVPDCQSSTSLTGHSALPPREGNRGQLRGELLGVAIVPGAVNLVLTLVG